MTSRSSHRLNARASHSPTHFDSAGNRKHNPGAALSEIRQAAAVCKACDLWKNATQTVFGEGKPGAIVMMVGEQPGDSEDRKGHPFVGPAGRLLDNALAEAGIDRKDVYVTNVVKHFKWSPAERGKRRIHKKPKDSEIVSRQRGQVVDSQLAPAVVATVHPSSILRARDDASRGEQLKHFVQDLKFVVKVAKAMK